MLATHGAQSPRKNQLDNNGDFIEGSSSVQENQEKDNSEVQPYCSMLGYHFRANREKLGQMFQTNFLPANEKSSSESLFKIKNHPRKRVWGLM